MSEDRTKAVHRAKSIRGDGSVSAVCFRTPRAINLSRAGWSNRWEAVTCKRCLGKRTILPGEEQAAPTTGPTITLPGRAVTAPCPSAAALADYIVRSKLAPHEETTRTTLRAMAPDVLAAYARQFILAHARETGRGPCDVLADIQAQEPKP